MPDTLYLLFCLCKLAGGMIAHVHKHVRRPVIGHIQGEHQTLIACQCFIASRQFSLIACDLMLQAGDALHHVVVVQGSIHLSVALAQPDLLLIKQGFFLFALSINVLLGGFFRLDQPQLQCVEIGWQGFNLGFELAELRHCLLIAG